MLPAPVSSTVFSFVGVCVGDPADRPIIKHHIHIDGHLDDLAEPRPRHDEVAEVEAPYTAEGRRGHARDYMCHRVVLGKVEHGGDTGDDAELATIVAR